MRVKTKLCQRCFEVNEVTNLTLKQFWIILCFGFLPREFSNLPGAPRSDHGANKQRNYMFVDYDQGLCCYVCCCFGYTGPQSKKTFNSFLSLFIYAPTFRWVSHSFLREILFLFSFEHCIW